MKSYRIGNRVIYLDNVTHVTFDEGTQPKPKGENESSYSIPDSGTAPSVKFHFIGGETETITDHAKEVWEIVSGNSTEIPLKQPDLGGVVSE